MELAERLRDAHVAYVLHQLRGDGFAALVDEQVDRALDVGATLTLDEVIARDQVKAVAAKYVATFTLPGAIPEIAGDIAARLRKHPSNERLVEDVVPRRAADTVVDTAARMTSVHRWAIGLIAENSSVNAWLAAFLRDLAVAPIDANLRLAQRVPGLSAALEFGQRFAAPAVREADQRTREIAEGAAAVLLERWQTDLSAALTTDEVAEALTDIWRSAAERRVSDLLDLLSEDDLVDLVGALYETWLEIRTSDYLRELIDIGVDYFFDTHGAMTLTELIHEFGLTRADLVEEAMRFAPSALAGLDRAGVLEDAVRRQLDGFYSSPEAQAVFTASLG